MKRGWFIVIEGLDGSGSTTQCENLRNYLDIRGIKSIITKEPTNNLIGGLIRGVLTHDWTISQEGLQLLFTADRAHHLQKEIIPALERGITVICDRYILSTMAFGAIEADMEWLNILNQKFLIPDITFVLQVEPATCLERISKSRGGFELFEDVEKLKKVQANYLLLSEYYHSIYFLNGNRDQQEILKEIAKRMEELLKTEHQAE